MPTNKEDNPDGYKEDNKEGLKKTTLMGIKEDNLDNKDNTLSAFLNDKA